MLRFWRAQTVFLARLYRSRLVTVAAIRGSCPAGGCITALCCDFRVMNAENEANIGLNEVALGIPVPRYWALVMGSVLGQHRAETLLARGALLRTTDAAAVGLIDCVVERERLLPTAEAEMRLRLAHPDVGRVATKRQMREALSLAWEAQWEAEAEACWTMLSHPDTVAFLGGVMQRLSQGKAGGGSGGKSGGATRETATQARGPPQHSAKAKL